MEQRVSHRYFISPREGRTTNVYVPVLEAESEVRAGWACGTLHAKEKQIGQPRGGEWDSQDALEP